MTTVQRLKSCRFERLPFVRANPIYIINSVDKPNYISSLQVQEIGTSKGCDSLFYISDTVHESVFHECSENLSSWQCAHALVKYQDNSTSGRGARASYQTISPEISARGSLLWAKVQIPIVTDRQGGRDKSAPRPYETDPIHPLSSIHS